MEDHFSTWRTYVSPHSAEASVELCTLSTNDFVRYILASIPAGWIESVLNERGHPTAMPMCSTLFLVHEPWIAGQIADHVSNISFPDESDRQRLVDSGWQVILDTGLFAFNFDESWLLGIDGLGYDFFDAHWRPFHERLRQRWQYDD